MNEEEVQEAPEAPEEQPQPQEQREKPPGYDPVDLSDLPEEKAEAIKHRIDYLYGQVKRGEKDWEVAQDHIRRLDESLNKVSGRLGHIEEEKSENDLASLRRMAVDAMEEGEYDRAQEINERILELKLAPKEVKEEPEEKPEEAVLPPQTQEVLTRWASEVDDSGNPVRPYVDENHPEHQKAIQKAQEIWNDPVARAKIDTIEDFLGILDKKMQGPKAPAVASTSPNFRPKADKKIELTEDQKRIARKLGIPEERYAAQLKAMG